MGRARAWRTTTHSGLSSAADRGSLRMAVPHKARKIESRAVSELGLSLKPYTQALRDSVDSMMHLQMIVPSAA